MRRNKADAQEKNTSPTSFPDFDEMKDLAQNDPTAFEAVRRQHIESFLDSVPEDKRRRLVGLQWQVDQIRILAATPMASCIAISNMMKDSLDRLNAHHVQFLKIAQNPLEQHGSTELSSATVLPFTPSTRH